MTTRRGDDSWHTWPYCDVCLAGAGSHGLAAGSDDGREVLVTGAAGGVGSVSVALLSALGYRVAAVTGRIEQSGDFLREMGANSLVARAELAVASSKPLESERWAACIDNVGSQMLARVPGPDMLWWIGGGYRQCRGYRPAS